MTTTEKLEEIYIYAKHNRGKVKTGNDVADHLNSKGFTTLKGTPYKYGRGIYVMINAAYHYIEKTKGSTEAGLIANAFVNAKGEGAWWHKPVKEPK